MQRNFPHLCSPLTVGNVTLRNRMCSAPMSGAEITADCCIGRSSRAFYELRAKGGAANVTVSEVMVHPDTDGSHAYHLNTTVPGSIPSFTLTADAIRVTAPFPAWNYPIPVNMPAPICRTSKKNPPSVNGAPQKAPVPTAVR